MGIKITKTPKKINVKWKKAISFVSSYDCPSCKTTVIGSLSKYVIRFLCEQCGQELIIDNEALKDDKR